MPDSTASSQVTDNPALNRLEIADAAGTSVLEYHRRGNRLHLTHTEVPQALEGKGIASRLAQAAMEMAQRDGLKVVPTCPFVVSWLERHPEHAGLVAREG